MAAYATDLTDEQWLLIAPLIPRPKVGGRRRTTNERRVIDGVLYLLKTGCQWRNLPNDFPRWAHRVWLLCRVGRERRLEAHSAPPVFHGSQGRWSQSVAEHRRHRQPKRPKPARWAASVVTTAASASKAASAIFAVDSLGLPLAISVTPANVHDLTGAKKVLPQVRKLLLRPSFSKIYADGAYIAQTFKDWAKEKFDATVQGRKKSGDEVQAVRAGLATVGGRAYLFVALRFPASDHRLRTHPSAQQVHATDGGDQFDAQSARSERACTGLVRP